MIKFEKVSLEEWINWFKSRGKLLSEEALESSYKNIKLPQRGTGWSAGYDFFAPFGLDIPTFCWAEYPTGIRFVTDDPNICLVLMPRSGLGFKHNMKLANTVGLIDADYQFSQNEGHIAVKLSAQTAFAIPAGKAYMQGVILPYFKTDDDDVKTKRDGGFGSTDKQHTEHCHTDAYDHGLGMEH